MILFEKIEEILNQHEKDADSKEPGIFRDLISEIPLESERIRIISGVRRSGKSTLLRQLRKASGNSLFLNFEDPRLADFELNDFNKLDQIIEKRGCMHLFFDEIQTVTGWERYIRAKHDKGFRIFITGSNASMLSMELGTKLTGRQVTHELFPFSYVEFMRMTEQVEGAVSLSDYLSKGGFPEFLRSNDEAILHHVFYDIIYRDIAVRHQIRRHETLKQMALYLSSNIGKPISYNNLKKHFILGATNTAVDFVSFYQDSYLLFTIPRFDFSIKSQVYNPRKIYSVDNGLTTSNSLSFSADVGRKLENAVFLELRKRFNQIFYFKENKECDFIVKHKDKVIQCIQVCYHLNDDNLNRELDGLVEAMEKTGLTEGTIVTFDQEDVFDVNKNRINAVPFSKWIKFPPTSTAF